MTMLTLATGTTFIMWLGEQITERGVGNGISLIIFAGIVLRLPQAIQEVYERLTGGGTGQALGVIVIVIAMILIIAAIVFVERGFRKIPINHARRMVGRQSIPQQQTHMPLKVNMGGVIPVIFASSILVFPSTILGFVGATDPTAGGWKGWLAQFANDLGQSSHPLHLLLYAAAIIFFTFFYVSIIFNTDEVANNLRKNGAFVPGIRPGKRTSDYFNDILTRLTTVGAIYLALVALLPQIMLNGIQFSQIPWIGPWIDSVSEFDHSNVLACDGRGHPVRLRRDELADRDRRGDGHDEPDRVSAHHAPLRRVPWPARSPSARSPQLLSRMLCRISSS